MMPSAHSILVCSRATQVSMEAGLSVVVCVNLSSALLQCLCAACPSLSSINPATLFSRQTFSLSPFTPQPSVIFFLQMATVTSLFLTFR